MEEVLIYQFIRFKFSDKCLYAYRSRFVQVKLEIDFVICHGTVDNSCLFLFPYFNKLVNLCNQPLLPLCVEWLKTMAEIIGNTIFGKQVKHLLSAHSFVCSVFFYAECNEECYVFVFLPHCKQS